VVVKRATIEEVCVKCQGALRNPPAPGVERGLRMAGSLTITTNEKLESALDTSESRRYCASCAPIVKDALQVLGFTFLEEDSTAGKWRAANEAAVAELEAQRRQKQKRSAMEDYGAYLQAIIQQGRAGRPGPPAAPVLSGGTLPPGHYTAQMQMDGEQPVVVTRPECTCGVRSTGSHLRLPHYRDCPAHVRSADL